MLLFTIAAGCKKEAPTAAGETTGTASAATPSAPAPAAAAAPPRRAIDCAAILKGSADHGSIYKPGGWGNVPAELQVLPPGAELCGAGSPYAGKDDTYPGALVRSAIFGPALGELYAPAIAKLGCKMNPPEVVGAGDMQSTRIHFRCANGNAGDIGTDTGYEFYSVSLAR